MAGCMAGASYHWLVYSSLPQLRRVRERNRSFSPFCNRGLFSHPKVPPKQIRQSLLPCARLLPKNYVFVFPLPSPPRATRRRTAGAAALPAACRPRWRTASTSATLPSARWTCRWLCAPCRRRAAKDPWQRPCPPPPAAAA